MGLRDTGPVRIADAGLVPGGVVAAGHYLALVVLDFRDPVEQVHFGKI